MGACFCHNSNNEIKSKLVKESTNPPEIENTSFSMKKENSMKNKGKERSMNYKSISIKAQTFVIHKSFTQFMNEYVILGSLGSGIIILI